MPTRHAYPDLATYLLESGETQESLALAVRASQAAISMIASGERQPRPDLAKRLIDHCNIPPGSFLVARLRKKKGGRR